MKFRGFVGLGFGLGLGGFGNGSVFGSQIWVWRIQGSGSGLVFGVRIRVWEFEGVRGSNGSRHCGWFWISTRYLIWFVRFEWIRVWVWCVRVWDWHINVSLGQRGVWNWVVGGSLGLGFGIR